MKDGSDIISIDQMILILILIMVSMGILTLPRSLAEIVPYDHWIIVLAAGLVAIVIIAIHAWIIKLKPRKQYFEILCDSLSKPIAYIVALAYIIYFVGIIGRLRLFGGYESVFTD